MSHEGRTDEVDADAADDLGGAGPSEFLLHDEVRQRAGGTSAARNGPGDPDPSTAGESPLPLSSECDLIGEIVESRWKAGSVFPREVVVQPASTLGPDGVVSCGWRQIHLPERYLTRVSGSVPTVDFELSADQEALRSAARDLLAGRSPMSVVRAATERGGVPDGDLWIAMSEQGWPGIAVSEADGGVGLGWVEAAIVLEEVGASLAPAPILGHLVALEFLATGERGPALLAGEQIAAVAPGVDGPVVCSPTADVLVTISDGGRLVGIDLQGEPPAAEPAMDLTRQLGWVTLDGRACVDLGGDEAVTRFMDLGAVAYAAEMLGLAQRVLTLTVEYAKERVQFGKPIGSFQAVKHRCADMLVDVEGMRSAVYWAAWCVSAGHADASVAASTAKCWCSDASMRVMASALQVHGGVGFTWEHDLHLYLKRAHLDSISFGDAAAHRSRLASLLRERVESGISVI